MIWIPLNQHEPPEKGDTREQAARLPPGAVQRHDLRRDGRDLHRRRPRDGALARRAHPGQVPRRPRLPGLPPRADAADLPQGGRSLETAIFPYGELGEWGDRVHISPYYPSYHLTIGETTLGQAIPEELSPEEMQRRARQRRAGHGPRARRPAAQGVSGPRRRAADEPPRRRADHGGRPGRGRRVRDAGRPQGGARAERGHRHRRLRAQRRPQAGVPARAVHAHGRRRDEHGRRPEDGDAGRRDAREHARGVVDADDRDADRHRSHRPAAADLRADAARRDHGQPARPSASPTRPPTTTPSGPRSTSRTRSWASTGTCRAGWSSIRHGSTSTASPAASAGPRRPGPTGSRPPTRSRVWARSWASPAMCSSRPSSASTPTRVTCTIPTSTAAGALRTSGGAIRRSATEPPGHRSARSRRRRTTRSRSSAARWGPRAGPLTDTRARVLDVDGDVIPGLYAAGNAMSSPLGMTYGGAGGTLGPAMVFGYLAGRDIARASSASATRRPLAAAHGGA